MQNSNQLNGLAPTVICDEIRAGSVIVDANIYLNDTETSALDQQILIKDSLGSLGNSSQGFFDSSQIIVQSTGNISLNVLIAVFKLERIIIQSIIRLI